MSEETTLADLLQLNLHKYEDEVRNIVDKAVKESGMEKVGAKAAACASLQRILGLSDGCGDCEGPDLIGLVTVRDQPQTSASGSERSRCLPSRAQDRKILIQYLRSSVSSNSPIPGVPGCSL